MAKKGTDVVGTACTVTSGPNKGKSGTYTVDEEGNLWCEGSWGGTQCATKCTDAVVSVTQVFDSTGNGVTNEYDGFFSNDAGEVFHVKSVVDAKSKEVTRLAVAQVRPIALSSLRNSKSAADRALRTAVEAHLAKRK